MKRLSKIKILVSLTICGFLMILPELAFAVSKPADAMEGISGYKISGPKRASKAARVRIPIKLISYEKVLVKNTQGISREEYKKAGELKHTLRARIERTNHFYIGKWHIETIPESWNREKKTYRTRLRFYRRYGNERDLEEYVGFTVAFGVLRGDDYLYQFEGFRSASFKDRFTHPILDVEVGIGPVESRELISKRPTQLP